MTSMIPAKEFAPEVTVPLSVVAAGLAILGAVVGLLGGTPDSVGWSVPIALAILALALLTLLLERWHKRTVAWLICGILSLMILWLRFGLGVSGALALLVAPSALSMVMLGPGARLAVTLVNLLLILGCWQGGRVEGSEMVVALAVLVIVVVIYEAVFRASRQLVLWSWQHYQKAQATLDEVRDNRSQLCQTLDELAHANRQLALLNQRLAAAHVAAEEAHKAKAAFVANVSHEFRTPLNMIIGLSDLLLETPHIYGSDISPLLLEDLEIVRRNSQHLLSMVNDVLDLSQIEAGRLALHRDRLNLAAIIENAVVVVQPLINKKQVEMKVAVAADLPTVYCDRTRLRQVIVNLLSNAARHAAPDDGTGSVTVEANADAQWVTVCVRDTGPGIPEEEAKHIFEPFYRGSFGARRAEGGSGLGLSISHQFIEMHGGKMWFESTLGVGSNFYFRLPLQAAPLWVDHAGRWLLEDWQWYERQSSGNLPNSTPKPPVLLCDPHDDLQHALARFNDQVNYRRVASLTELADALAEMPPQLLLINAATPQALFEQMQQAQSTCHSICADLPLLGCCVAPKLGNVQAAGAIGQLLKPVTQADLNAILDQQSPTPQITLLVDDDEDCRRLFQRMLTARHPQMQVVTACNGTEALLKMQTESPDLVLLDVKLPDIDGWAVLQTKMRNPALAAIPTFLLSAQDPHPEPFSTPFLAISAGQRISFQQLLRCVQVVPHVLGNAQSGVDSG